MRWGNSANGLGIVFLLFIVMNIHATHRSSSDALEIARLTLTRSSSLKKHIQNNSPCKALSIAEESEAYYVIDMDGGFLLVSTDTELPEILGYSASGNFVKSSLPPALQMWLNGYDNEVKTWREKKQRHSPITADYISERETIAPLLSTQWGQDIPYNRYCPIDCEGRSCPTGCVATALAQIMNYWQWPKQGIGTHRMDYVCASDSSYTQELFCDFASTTYQWENMVDDYGLGIEYSLSQTTEEQQHAVATLMYHIGQASGMHYAHEGSGLDNAEIKGNAFSALFSHFDYDENVQVFAKDYCQSDTLESILYDELAEKRPVFVTGAGLQGGHAFVCDGYDNHLFHFNWGWYGIADGWFRLSALEPSSILIGSYQFNNYVQFFTGIQPKSQARPISHNGQLLVADSITIQTSYELLPWPDDWRFQLEVTLYNYSVASILAYPGIFKIIIYPATEKPSDYFSLSEMFPDSYLLAYGYGSATMTAKIPLEKERLSQLGSDEYNLSIYCQSENGEWFPISILGSVLYKSFIKPSVNVFNTEGPVSIHSITGQLIGRFPQWSDCVNLKDLNLPHGVYCIKQGMLMKKIVL